MIFRHMALVSIAVFGLNVSAKTLDCSYIGVSNGSKQGYVKANIEEGEFRDIVADALYEFWSKDDNKNLPTNHFAPYPSRILSMLITPEDHILFNMENSEAYETVSVKYYKASDEYVGSRDVSWSTAKNRDQRSIAICKFN